MAAIITGTYEVNWVGKGKTSVQWCEHERCQGLDADIHKLHQKSIPPDTFNENVIAESRASVLPK